MKYLCNCKYEKVFIEINSKVYNNKITILKIFGHLFIVWQDGWWSWWTEDYDIISCRFFHIRATSNSWRELWCHNVQFFLFFTVFCWLFSNAITFRNIKIKILLNINFFLQYSTLYSAYRFLSIWIFYTLFIK